MPLLRWDPFHDPFRDLDRLASQLASGTRTPQGMPMDAYRSGDSYRIDLDLPGVDPASIDLTSERNTLTIQAERRSGYSEGDDVLLAERPQGQFTRQLLLGEGLDTARVQADYADGVLRLTIPVAQVAQARKIEISKGGGPSGPTMIDVAAEDASNQAGDPSAT